MTSSRAVLLTLCASLVLAADARARGTEIGGGACCAVAADARAGDTKIGGGASRAVTADTRAQDTKIVLRGPAARGVSVVAGAPATASGRRVSLPTAGVAIAGSTATVDHRGTLTLRAGKRSVKLTALRVTVGRRSVLSARLGGVRRTVARIAAPPTRRAVDAAGTYVTEAPLMLTAAISRRLGVPRGRLGTIDLEASATPAPSGTDIPGAPSAPTVTGPPTPGGSTTAPRPVAAVSITGGAVRWSPRLSWLNYLASSGEADGVSAQAPATYDASALTFSFPITGGWFDAATGAAVIETSGASDFRWVEHALDLSFADWTFDLASTTPKAVVTVQRASGAAKKTIGSRQPIGLVKPGGIAPEVSGSTITWSGVPLTLAAEGVALYRAYLYDSDQGRFTISATLG
jgi:hypothetical protein